MSADPSLVSYRNLTLRDAIRGAWKIQDFQIVGPDWISTARYEIDAKLPAGSTSHEIPEMLQSLLEERFELAWRRERKEMLVYTLIAAKDGLRLKPSEVKADNQPTAMGTDGQPRPLVGFGGTISAVTVTAPAASLLTFAGFVSRFTNRPVVDETGVQGLYDFSLTFAPEVTTGLAPGISEPGGIIAEPTPSLSDSLRKYGLRIEPRRSEIEVFVVTHIEKTPKDN